MAGERRNHSQLRKWKLRPDAAFATSRRSICYVPTQHLLRPDAVTDTSGRNFRSILVPIKWASFASCTSLRKFIRFIESTDTTALGDGFDCAGWRIRLRWVKDTTSLGGRVNFVGWIKHLMLQNEVVDFAEWSTWIRRLMLLNFQL